VSVDDLPIRSFIPEICWPAVPSGQGMALLSLLFQLEHSQWWPAEEHLRRQAAQLRLLIDHANRTVPFYRDRPIATTIDPLQLLSEEWLAAPILTRRDVQEAGEALLSREVPESHGAVSEVFTSGSTGKPIRALRTELWRLFWSAFTVRDHLWHRRDFAGTLAVIRESGAGKAPYPNGELADNWGRSTAEVFSTGPSASLNIMTPIDRQLEWLERQNPDYLLTHPSIAARLAASCIREGIRLGKLRQVETISESLHPRVRDLCREAWGVPVVDLYSAREAGYVALQCPSTENYHVQAEGILVEVLDKTGRPCGPGETGVVVVTPLHNFAMPLIRYELGDLAEVGEPCPCGRGLPALKRILGRRQNMLVMPWGEERWPLLSSGNIKTLLSLAPIRQYQFAQKGPGHIDLRLVVVRPLSDEEEAALKRWVQEKFGYPFDVSLMYLDEIPREPSGKFDDFVREDAALNQSERS